MADIPHIYRVGWVDASSVLGHEERGFSVWLSEHLDLLAEALELPDLALSQRELRVDEFRADILAIADDGSDEGLPVIIENQYGRSNHDHLGKVITYLAGQQRGLGVWIVEHFSEAHVAAVDFLNRTSDESVGYALVRVRFAPAPDGHYVDLQVAARPNAWLKGTLAAGSGAKSPAPERQALLGAVYELARGDLTSHGWTVSLDSGFRFILLRFKEDHPLAGHGYLTLRASSTSFRFRHVVSGPSLEASTIAVSKLRARYGKALTAMVPPGTGLVWNAGLDRANAANDQWYAEHPDGGWRDLDEASAAQWAIQVCNAWMQVLADDPPIRLMEAADAQEAVLPP